MGRLSLVVATTACLAVGFMVAEDSRPKSATIDRLAAQIQRRFSTVGDKFGISRLGEPYTTHQPVYSGRKPNASGLEPENEEEKKVVDELSKGSWDAVVFTAGIACSCCEGRTRRCRG